MVKHPPPKDQILYIFSSSELLIFYMTVFYTFFNFNLYSAILIIFIILKTVILHPIKKYMESSKFGIRPSKAFNCNMMNCGGKPNSGGFPSGHMMIIGMLSFIVYNLYTKKQNKNSIIIYIILIITTFIGRIFTYCHTPLQCISGLLMGMLFGIILYFIDDTFEKKVPIKIYKKHKEDFYNNLDSFTN